MKIIVYSIVSLLIFVTVYAILTKPAKSVVSHTYKENKNIKFVQDVKNESKNEKIVSKEIKKEKHKSSNLKTIIKQNDIKKDREEPIEDTLPLEYNDYKKVSTIDVAGNQVSIITDKKIEQSDDTPPSVPYIVSGKVEGESFTITLPITLPNSKNILIVKTDSGKIITKPLDPQDLLKKGMIDIGEVDKTDDTNDEQSQNQEEDKTQDSGSIVPPQAPRI